MDRLHTCYAPVRRSPPRYCYLALPLDLHVLSLPLAFILSQDQTLHCKNCLFRFTFLTRLVSLASPGGVRHTLSLSSHQCQSSFVSVTSFGRKRVQRYNHFSNRPNIFLHFFENIFESIVNQRFANEKNFHFCNFSMLFCMSKTEIGPQILQKLPPLQRPKYLNLNISLIFRHISNSNALSSPYQLLTNSYQNIRNVGVDTGMVRG